MRDVPEPGRVRGRGERFPAATGRRAPSCARPTGARWERASRTRDRTAVFHPPRNDSRQTAGIATLSARTARLGTGLDVARGQEAPPLPNEHTVLFVDDEVNILKAFAAAAARRRHERPLRVARLRGAGAAREAPHPGGGHRPAHARDVRCRLPRPGAGAPPGHGPDDADRLHRDERRRRRHQPRRDLPVDHEAVERRRAARPRSARPSTTPT